MPPVLSWMARRRVVALAGKRDVDSVHVALAYACRVLAGNGVEYVWHPDDLDNDDWHGVSYVQRDGLPTVAYDWRKRRFLWKFAG